MVKIIDRSHNLQRFESTFKELDDKCHQEKLELLIRGCILDPILAGDDGSDEADTEDIEMDEAFEEDGA
ncbi:hypothetical protein BGX34_000803 [Mortierella sp. NVP85]|nr:hypothetical protein BGX34_000803 [Mortierella sp. NVP85]